MKEAKARRGREGGGEDMSQGWRVGGREERNGRGKEPERGQQG